VTAPGGLTSVDITSDDYGIYVDGFSEGTVPEPSSLLLLGAGLAGVAGMLRRRRRSN
jgi:hypothetical protein